MWGFSRFALLRMERSTWRELLAELERRGGGWRESGAFLCSGSSSTRPEVTRVVYFDDLDPECLKGDIHIVGTAYSKLWDICEAEDLRVVGDVHTHPGDNVAQSGIDANSPALARVGHVALIVPKLASGEIQPSAVGVHLYRGDAGWRSWFNRRASIRFDVRRSR
jgi:proteasome lid subunit RPN8/RPN11